MNHLKIPFTDNLLPGMTHGYCTKPKYIYYEISINWLFFPACGRELHGELDVPRMCKKSNEIQGSLLLKRYVIVMCLALIFIFSFVGQIQIVIFVLYKLRVHGQYRQWFQRPIDSLLHTYLHMQRTSNKRLSKTDLRD